MCGIVGVIQSRKLKISDDQFDRMLDCLSHRGPDGRGIWRENNVTIGHRRLSVIDPCETGAQPAISHDRRYVLTYNGEIYNYLDIKSELEKGGRIQWRGSSDTEVLLEYYARHGLRRTLDRIDGMYAFAIWDRVLCTLTLARDPFGEKPLVYAEFGEGLVFASEIRCFESVPAINTAIDPEALSAYLQHGSVPYHLTIYKGIKKLQPGTSITVGLSGLPVVERYWHHPMWRNRAIDGPQLDTVQATNELERALVDSCRQKLLSDVPLGAFLSGGIDSSLVVALMQSQSSKRVKTFSLGFEQLDYDELPFAESIAHYLDTDHTSYRVTEEDALKTAPEIGLIFDEPFSDASSIPMTLLAQLARHQVTVAVTGDGGDEHFAGYQRYQRLPELWQMFSGSPCPKGVWKSLSTINPRLLTLVLHPFAFGLGKKFNNVYDLGYALQRYSLAFSADTFSHYYVRMMQKVGNGYRYINDDVVYQSMPSPLIDEEIDKISFMSAQDTIDYLPNVLLTKVDRASMHSSLECRAPLLDRTVAELAGRIGFASKIQSRTGKVALREILARHVPIKLFDRPKQGFSPPIAHWLKGPLKEWCLDLMCDDVIVRQGLLNVRECRSCVKSFYASKNPDPSQLWTLVMLQSWMAHRGLH